MFEKIATAILLHMTKKEIQKYLESMEKEANAKLNELISEDLYDYSNTMQRYHQVKLQEEYIGRVERDDNGIISAKFLTGKSHYTRNQLILRAKAMQNFLSDINVTPDKIREQQERLARRMFNLEATDPVTQEQIEQSKQIWGLWRKLGLSRDKFDESQTILTNIVDEVELHGFDNTSGKLQFIRNMAVQASKFTQEDINSLLASKTLPEAYVKEEFGMEQGDDIDWDTILNAD